VNERIAVKYHDRLVEALRERVCSEGEVIDGRCYHCGSRACGEARNLLAEIVKERP
jgi:hypothetical protein